MNWNGDPVYHVHDSGIAIVRYLGADDFWLLQAGKKICGPFPTVASAKVAALMNL
jgi:hypothetical protein